MAFACSNAKDLKFTKDNQDKVMDKVKNSRDLTAEEVVLLTTAMMRTLAERDSLEGKPIGELIKEQKAITEQADAREKETKGWLRRRRGKRLRWPRNDSIYQRWVL